MPNLGTDTAVALSVERDKMKAYRLSFIRACRQTPYSASNLRTHINMRLQTATETEVEDWENITIFERMKPEIPAFFQEPGEINLTDEQIDDLFRLAMQIENA